MCDFLSGRQREKTVTEERGHPTIQLLCILVVGMTSLISSPKCRDAKTSNPLLSDPTDWPEGNGLLPLSYRPTTLRFWCPPFPYSTCMENSSWFSTLCTLPHPNPHLGSAAKFIYSIFIECPVCRALWQVLGVKGVIN